MRNKRSGKISTLGSQVTSVVSVALVLLIVGILAAVAISTRNLNDALMSNVSVIVKLAADTPDDEAQHTAQIISSQPFAATVEYTAADEVLAQEMEHNAEVLEIIGENPYASELEVTLAPQYVHPDSITQVANRLMFMDNVDEVLSQTDLIRAMSAISSKTILVLGCVAAVLFAISIVLIYNTVSIAVYGRRFIIRTMQLVGATAAFIRRPFLRAGAWWGVASAAIASAMLWGLKAYVGSLGVEMQMMLSAADLAWVCVGMLLLGLAICMIATFFATTRYLRASYDSLYNS